MFYKTLTARTPPKSPPAATEWCRPLLQHDVCSERVPFVRSGGYRSAKRVLLSLVTLTLWKWRGLEGRRPKLEGEREAWFLGRIPFPAS